MPANAPMAAVDGASGHEGNDGVVGALGARGEDGTFGAKLGPIGEAFAGLPDITVLGPGAAAPQARPQHPSH